MDRQVAFDPGELPKYGGLGTFGIQGFDINASLLEMLCMNESYPFELGRVYNIEASAVIRNGGGASGAHNDISRPEVAHAFWQAIMARG